MGRYTISTRPRREAASLTSSLSETTSLASTLSISSTLPTHTSTLRKPCFYCSKLLADDSTRRQHIANTPECTAAERAALQRAVERLENERRQREDAVPAAKRRRVTVEDVADEEAPQHSAPGHSLPEPFAAGDTSASAQVDPEPGPSRSTDAPQTSRDRPARRGLRRRGGLYVEDYPDPLAGSPISEERAVPPDLDAYMQSCGRMADPEDFEAAELLMTSGLSDAAKDRHLKSTKVRTIGYMRKETLS
jgi:hypothetical protein